jgi:hypothetical protein
VATQEEINSIQENDTWELTELLRGCCAIGLKWVFKQKKDELGAVIKNKAHLVAKGYVQQAGVDFNEVSLRLRGWSPCDWSRLWRRMRAGRSIKWM